MRQRISFCTTSDGVRIAYAVAEQGLEAWNNDLEAVADSLGWKRFSLIGL